MPPRIVTSSQAGTGFRAWYEGIPPITRFLATAMLGVTLACNFGLVPPVWVALLWGPITRKLEVWRLVTNFFMLGRLSFSFLLQMIWLIQYGGPLESTVYQFEPADYALLLLFNAGLLLAVSPVADLYFLGQPLILSIIYVWSKAFPDGEVSLYGLIRVRTFYLPFAFAAISLLMGQSIVPDLAGIAVGHVYYFLHDIYPATSGQRPLSSPAWLKRWLADAGVRGAAPRVPAAVDTAFQAFRGAGRRLGGS